MSGKSKEEVAFELVSKLKGVGVWGENNMVQILDMYAECLEATSGLRALEGRKQPSALRLTGHTAVTGAPAPQQAAPAQAPRAPQPPVQQAPAQQAMAQQQVHQQQQRVQQAYQQQVPQTR